MTFSIHHLTQSDFPKLWEVPHPPESLYVQGSTEALQLLAQLPDWGLAVVGTRNPQSRSAIQLRKWIHELKGSSLIIISGLARGIDAVAHSAAVEAGLPTIAILGAGLELNYPRENQDLRKRILNTGGLVVSEFSPEMPALGHQFLKRNRFIAGWSKATWVVEAGIPSGALSTARWARELDRVCFAVPCCPGDFAMRGNQVLLDRDHSLAFWGVHSLGAVWMKLATWSEKQSASAKVSKQMDPVNLLASQVQMLTYRRGGAQIQDLLDWSLSQGWSGEKFFSTLQLAVQQNLIIQGGLFSDFVSISK